MASKIPKALIGGNWKCNGTVAQVESLISMLNSSGPLSPNSEVVIAVPSIHLTKCNEKFRKEIAASAQDCSFKEGYGAFTGEISADMLADSKVKWTLTGHSERRVGFGFPGEGNRIVGVKTANGLKSGLSVIACIGEQLDDRNKQLTKDVCSRQLEGIAGEIKAEKDWDRIVIAYEPVWAIGTGVVASPEVAQETHFFIREWLRKNVSNAVASHCRIIYGGSVTAKNCDELYAQPDINGFLVGGASLKEEFIKIINCTKK